MTNSLEVIFTPALLPLYNVKDKVVVVVDILRATTSMCVAFQTGAKRILPVSTPEEAMLFKDFDFLCAAERNAVKLAGFDLGNSPFEFENPFLKEKSIAFTTTNGTKAIKMAKEMGAGQIVIGSFLNISALCHYLVQQQKPVVILCAGWKDKFNIEDSLFGGMVVSRIKDHFEIDCDSALTVENLYQAMQHDMESIVRKSSHAKRFQLLHTQHDDVSFCLQTDTLDIVPVMHGEYLINPVMPSKA